MKRSNIGARPHRRQVAERIETRVTRSALQSGLPGVLNRASRQMPSASWEADRRSTIIESYFEAPCRRSCEEVRGGRVGRQGCESPARNWSCRRGVGTIGMGFTGTFWRACLGCARGQQSCGESHREIRRCTLARRCRLLLYPAALQVGQIPNAGGFGPRTAHVILTGVCRSNGPRSHAARPRSQCGPCPRSPPAAASATYIASMRWRSGGVRLKLA